MLATFFHTGFGFIVETVGGPALIIFGSMLAGVLGVPQGINFESTLAFEVGTVVLALVAVTVVAAGFVSALRAERKS